MKPEVPVTTVPAEPEKTEAYKSFEDGMKKILKVPKTEIERLEAEEKARKQVKKSGT